MNEWVTGYMASDMATVTDWHGTPLGKAKVIASWATPFSYVSERWFQVECTIDGVTYTGRTAGEGMSYRGKRKVRQ